MADPALTLASDTICHVIVKGREFDAQDVETGTDLASNGSDDRMIASLEDHAGDPTEAELAGFESSSWTAGAPPAQILERRDARGPRRNSTARDPNADHGKAEGRLERALTRSDAIRRR